MGHGIEIRGAVAVPALTEHLCGVEGEDDHDTEDGDDGDHDQQFNQGEALKPLVIPVKTGIDQGESCFVIPKSGCMGIWVPVFTGTTEGRDVLKHKEIISFLGDDYQGPSHNNNNTGGGG